MKEFNKYTLIDGKGNVAIPSKKPGFCLVDVEQISPNPAPRKFVSCAQTAEMGVSAGWAEVYRADIRCQFLIIDGLSDGDYTLLSTTHTAHTTHKYRAPQHTYLHN